MLRQLRVVKMEDKMLMLRKVRATKPSSQGLPQIQVDRRRV